MSRAVATPSNAALADSIMENAEPLVARELVSLTLGSADPDDHRRFLELMHKRRQTGGVPAGAIINVTFDTSGAFTATTVAPPPEADDQRPALEAPSVPDDIDLDASIDLGQLFGAPDPATVAPPPEAP